MTAPKLRSSHCLNACPHTSKIAQGHAQLFEQSFGGIGFDQAGIVQECERSAKTAVAMAEAIPFFDRRSGKLPGDDCFYASHARMVTA